MILSEWFSNKIKKVSIFKTNDSFSNILYKSKDKKVSEIVWNGTNEVSPKTIISKTKKEYLYKHSIKNTIPNINEIPTGQRFFRYKTRQEIFKDRLAVLKVGWANNIQNCNKRYNNFQEYLEVSTSQMNRKILVVETKLVNK